MDDNIIYISSIKSMKSTFGDINQCIKAILTLDCVISSHITWIYIATYAN